jgi:hypothetical protein
MPLELSNSRPSKSLDFGKDGFTGSVSMWHELLQMTAPDPECGLVFVRGDFPDHPDSILARAQRRNQVGTFGMTIKVPPEANWVQEPTPAQGMINLRWPCTRFHWTRSDDKLGSIDIASFVVCSFYKEGTLYQIARVVPRRLTKATPSTSLENVSKAPLASNGSGGGWDNIEFTVDVGGLIRFGCPSTAVNRARNDKHNPTAVPPPFCDKYTRTPEQGKAFLVSCTSDAHRKRLEIRVWIDREAQELTLHDCQSPRLQHGPVPTDEHNEECCYLHVLKNGLTLQDDRATVIVASFSLVDAENPLINEAQPVIPYDAVKSYLGVVDRSLWAPYRLWSTLIGPSSSTGDSFELNAIGRAVETILGVASLPRLSRETSCTSSTMSPDVQGGIHNTPQARNGVALLKNIITPQFVDLESQFWQVRLLAKAAELLKVVPNWERDHKSLYPTQRQQYRAMQERYRSNIIVRLQGVCLWVLQVARAAGMPDQLQDRGLGLLTIDANSSEHPLDIDVISEDSASKRRCKQLDSGKVEVNSLGDQKYYCAMTIWYIIHQLPEILKADIVLQGLWERFTDLAFIRTPDKSGLVAIDNPTGCIVRSYHNVCFANICKALRSLDPDRYTGACDKFKRQVNIRAQINRNPNWQQVELDLAQIEKQAVKWQARARKAMRLFEQGRLSGQNLGHEAANLAYVGPELAIKATAITSRDRSCLDIARQLVGSRKPTTVLSPGRSRILRWDPNHDIRSAKPRPAPWEVSCLAQHVPCNLGVVKSAERGRCIDACKEFMISDYTFMASWDASRLATVGQWWDFITSSVICANMLEEAIDKKDDRQEDRQGRNDDGDDDKENALDLEKIQLLRSLCDYHRESRDRAAVVGFDFLKQKPRLLYHSDSTARSLEDTPDVYKLNQSPEEVQLRHNLRHYLYDVNYMPQPERSMETIKNGIAPSKVHNLSCFDIIPITDRNDLPELSEPIPHGRADPSFWFRGNPLELKQKKELKKLFDSHPGLIDMYLIGRARDHAVWRRNSQILGNDNIRLDLLASYQRPLLRVLNDSVRDY